VKKKIYNNTHTTTGKKNVYFPLAIGAGGRAGREKKIIFQQKKKFFFGKKKEKNR